MGWAFSVAIVVAADVLAYAGDRFTARQGTIVESALVCDDEQKQAIGATSGTNAPEVRAMRNEIRRAIALFRFHRSAEAQAQLDRAARRLEQKSSLLSAGARSDWTTALTALRRCLDTQSPPPMTRLNVRALKIDGAAHGAGVYIRIDEIPIGRTAANGTVQAQVPSGPVRVTAIVPPNSFGEALLTLKPGGRATASVTLDPDKEPTEETDLELVDANNGVVRRTASSLTLQFVRDNRRVRLRSIESVELLNRFDDVDRELRDFFKIAAGAIAAVDVSRFVAALPHDGAYPIRLRVTAIDSQEFIHSNIIELRLD